MKPSIQEWIVKTQQLDVSWLAETCLDYPPNAGAQELPYYLLQAALLWTWWHLLCAPISESCASRVRSCEAPTLDMPAQTPNSKMARWRGPTYPRTVSGAPTARVETAHLAVALTRFPFRNTHGAVAGARSNLANSCAPEHARQEDHIELSSPGVGHLA